MEESFNSEDFNGDHVFELAEEKGTHNDSFKDLNDDKDICPSTTDNTESIFNFSMLPWVIFLSILQFFKISELCQLSLVNKLWRKACRDPSLWRCLDLREHCSSITDDELIHLTSLSNNVVNLRISECQYLTDVGVCSALRQCASLVELTLVHCQLSDKVLEAVGEYCQCLKKLDLSSSLNFSDDGVRKVCQGCTELEELLIDQSPKLTTDILVSLANHCSMLKSLSTERIADITDSGLLTLLQGCPRLQTLRLPFCGLTNQCVYHIILYCHDIHWLDLRGVLLDDDDVCSLVEACPKLECLNLGLCHNLTDRAAFEISKKCNMLKYLFLVHNKVTDQGLFHLGEHCKSLQRLDVSWCPAITKIGARHVLQGCPNLKHLGLVRCDKVSDAEVNELSSHFPQVFLSTVKTVMNKMFIERPTDTIN